mgnify:CR=1 FL=1
MKAISLRQPWASLVAIGAKQIETRSWFTSYRGPIAIHASARLLPADRALLRQEPFLSALLADELVYFGAGMQEIGHRLPLGCVVATAQLVRVWPTDSFGFLLGLSEAERAFGDYGPGRWACLLEDVRPLAEPVPAKGALGLWEWVGDEQAKYVAKSFTYSG